MKEFLVGPQGTPGKRRRSNEDDHEPETPSKKLQLQVGPQETSLDEVYKAAGSSPRDDTGACSNPPASATQLHVHGRDPTVLPELPEHKSKSKSRQKKPASISSIDFKKSAEPTDPLEPTQLSTETSTLPFPTP